MIISLPCACGINDDSREGSVKTTLYGRVAAAASKRENPSDICVAYQECDWIQVGAF